jgi:dipeptidyl aminopeptidase/acylaminoacyl peptidase
MIPSNSHKEDAMTAPRTKFVGIALLLTAAGALLSRATTSADTGYQKPPRAIRDVLDAPPAPLVALSPAREYLLLIDWRPAPRIADLAEPVLRLAGHRINPRTNGPDRAPRFTGFTLQPLNGGKAIRVSLPAGARPGAPSWAPDGRQFAFLNTTATGIELWLGEPTKGTVRRVPNVTINAAYGEPLRWLPDSKALLCQAIVKDRGVPPAAPKVPPGPTILEGSGKAAPAWTFQDLLRNRHDEDLFDYYATSQLTLVDATTGKMTAVGKPGVFRSCSPSPDGRHLLVERIHRPYSYLLPSFAFPRKIEVWSRDGAKLFTLADLPLADRVPIEGVPTGPRSAHWLPTQPAQLVWVEALDEGDPRKKVEHRDRVLTLAAPFDAKAKPRELARTQQRFIGLAWDEKGQALLSDYERDKRRRRVFLLDPASSERPRLLWDRSILDRYRDPGTPLMRRLPSGHTVIRRQGDDIFLSGPGSSPKGDRPFLDRFNLATGKATRLFHSDASSYESVVDLLADNGSRWLTRHESPTSPPNYFIRTAGSDERKALTHFKDPTPQLRKITRQRVTYKRADGTNLSFTLYLPPDYKAGTRLPTVVWAYPREYTDASLAGQITGSTNRFTTIPGPSHLFFVLQGYAVLDGASMPVVGSAEKANDTYVEQIVSSAKAAIDKAAEMGVTDRDRVGVGGHSYGAFMTANLLAHSNLFRAGIARSGAYNRTLTPFGFQAERRTLWQAPEVYMKMSPFLHAHKIKAPMLLIHGEVDNNSGTFPMQSERMYQGIRGNGGTVRYVTLPHESHGYAAKESVEHALYEMIAWFDKHVKNAPARGR